MNLPTFFVLNGYKIHTIGIFLTVAFFISLFVLWQEGRKDGFSEEKLFDLFAISLFSSLFFSRIFYAFANRLGFYGTFYNVIRFWTPGFNSLGYLVGFFIPLVILPRKWKWSMFRILDIFSLAFSLGLSIIALGLIAYYKQFTFLFLFSGYLLMFVGLGFLRKKAMSGLVFSIFVFVNIFVGTLFFPGKINLIFYVCLFTISLVNFVFRIKDYMDKNQPKENILELLKNKLLVKSKRLEARQQRLIEEDPYLEEGRSEGNSDMVDEAILEDSRKELVDIKKASLKPVISQVRRALARMKLGKYGLCEICGEAVEEARLDIYPEATTCSTCFNKKKQETL